MRLKLESKDPLLVAFWQNKPTSQKPCMSRSWWSSYHPTVKSCWVLVYSALLCCWFTGSVLEDMIASLTWPCQLPPGWSVEWESNGDEWCHEGFTWCHYDIYLPLLFPLQNSYSELFILCMNSVCNIVLFNGTYLMLWNCCSFWNSPSRECCLLVTIQVVNRGCIGLDPTDGQIIQF